MSHFMKDFLFSIFSNGDIPVLKKYNGNHSAPSWTTIEYSTYYDDVKRTAGYWLKSLSSMGVSQGDTIGLWLTGHEYTDWVHMYALCAAGLIPQVFSTYYSAQGVAMVEELMTMSSAKVLLYDPEFEHLVSKASCVRVSIPDLIFIKSFEYPMPTLPDVSDEDIAIIFHTSGTTSGRPKLIPETHGWVRSLTTIQWRGYWQGSYESQDILNNLGSLSMTGTATAILAMAPLKQCMILSSKAEFDADELLSMIQDGGLNRLLLFGPRLSKLLGHARINTDALHALRNLRQIVYTGASPSADDETWMKEVGLPVTSLYASTEAAPCLVTDIEHLDMFPCMKVIPGVHCKFIPTDNYNSPSSGGTTERQAGRGRLYDFFIPSTAPNCPHPTVRNRPDGHITGDLFEEVSSGWYAFRGRNDDWVKTGSDGLFCDTKSIEDDVMRTCSDVVGACTVIGHDRAFIVLIVEPTHARSSETTHSIQDLQTIVFKRIQEFNGRLFTHERIHKESHILVVPEGILDRTGEKGNIRRKMVETRFKEELDDIYACSQRV